MRPSLLVLAGLLPVFIACTAPTPAPPPATSTPPATPLPSTPPAPTADNLVVWVPDWMWQEDEAARSSNQAAALLEETISRFEAAEDVSVEIVRKPPSGEAGLLSFLTSSAAVAPSIVPDIIVLSLGDADKAAQAGLLQPLDPLLDAGIQSDLPSFAADTARTEAGWFAVPFAAWFEHLAFRPSALSDPPINWDALQTAAGAYAFPAGGPEADLPDSVAVHYLSVVPTGEDPVRNETALRLLLRFYRDARNSGTLDPATLTAAGPGETWPIVRNGQAAMAHTDSRLWLADDGRSPGLRFGPIPTADGIPRSLGRGWALAVATPNTERQELSAKLINQLLEPDDLARWSEAADLLPTRRSALALWPQSGYTAYARDGLDGAIRPPSWLDDSRFTGSVHRAVLDVLNGNQNVEAVVRTAAETW